MTSKLKVLMYGPKEETIRWAKLFFEAGITFENSVPVETEVAAIEHLCSRGANLVIFRGEVQDGKPAGQHSFSAKVSQFNLCDNAVVINIGTEMAEKLPQIVQEALQ